MESELVISTKKFPNFQRQFLKSTENFTVIGSGLIGGKASGLAFIKNILNQKLDMSKFPAIEISIPKLVVITTDYFDRFIARNNLYEMAYSDESDIRKIFAFRNADLPAEILGDLRSIVQEVRTPLAIRSSSKLEDDKDEPFAGIYATKMVPNNQASADDRFRELDNAIKFVYASTFFKAARDYIDATRYSIKDEKMAVIIQEVVGEIHQGKYYPNLSGVARSYNYYPTGKAKPEDGVISLALGLGKQIVDGGLSWTYSPSFPKAVPPAVSPIELLKNSQTKFWAVNMSSIAKYSPISEAQFLTYEDISSADFNNTLKYIASTYNLESSRIVMGVGSDGPRLLNFAPLLVLNEFKVNDFMKELLMICEDAVQNPVEIEFAANFDKEKNRMKVGFLQVRPMIVSYENVDISEDDIKNENVLLISERVLGNGIRDDIRDIVYVKPESFETRHTGAIALEIEEHNKYLLKRKIPYLLVGFGRWGSSDPWLGIPVEWGQIAGTKVIVESTLPGINVDLSQGSHFFHNLTSFKVSYFSLHHEIDSNIDWSWLNKQEIISDKKFTRHVKLKNHLKIKIDGRIGKGVILK